MAKKRWIAIFGAALFIGAASALFKFCPKSSLLDGYSFSSAFYDRQGRLLHLSLSSDDKYRQRILLKDIPDEAIESLLLYEDRWFRYHFGVNPFSILRAVFDMMAGGRRQGASTITMQVARQVYHIDSTSFAGKVEQIFRALYLEALYSKDEILEAYFNISPYGGNIEGIGAAALVYFGTDVQKLNLLQSIMLTVIPQNPGKRALFSAKGIKEAATAAERLKKSWRQYHRDKDTAVLDLPLLPAKNLPFEAPHLVQRLKKKYSGQVVTTIDADFQKMLEDIIRKFIEDNEKLGVSNAAAIIVDNKTTEVLAYAGSADFFNRKIKGQVDGIRALRSPGSVLKPFIYALALEQGLIHPLTMLKDVPCNYGLYTPENFDHSFYGLLDATKALVYSRNVPAVDLLKALKENSFYKLLQKSGVRKLQDAFFYGLALALGGAEVSVEDLAALYAMLGNYGEFSPLKYLKNEETTSENLLLPEAAYLTLKMLEQNPVIDEDVLPYQRVKEKYKVRWKTGTSYGFRDAWTAGVAGDYVVVVWVGNFDGTPNNNFIGREVAAPLFFKIIRKLDALKGIAERTEPRAGLNIRQVKICRPTGDIADKDCPDVVTGDFIPGVSAIKMSKISRLIPIDVASGKRACRHTPPKTRLERFEFWPSDVRKAFAEAGLSLKMPPDFMQNCMASETAQKGQPPQIIFPAAGTKILQRAKNWQNSVIPLRASADADVEVIYWFVNEILAGQTKPDETLTVVPELVQNRIKAVDDLGREQEVEITVRLVE